MIIIVMKEGEKEEKEEVGGEKEEREEGKASGVETLRFRYISSSSAQGEVGLPSATLPLSPPAPSWPLCTCPWGS